MKYLNTRHTALIREFQAVYGNFYAKVVDVIPREVGIFKPGDVVYGILPDWMKDHFDEVGGIEYHDIYLHPVTGELQVRYDSKSRRRYSNRYEPAETG